MQSADHSPYVKFVVYVPTTHADAIRDVLGKMGAGKIGEYSYSSFSIKGIGRFIPSEKANPAIGSKGKLEAVEEERIETICRQNLVNSLVTAIKAVHPYEEIAYDVHPLVDEFTPHS